MFGVCIVHLVAFFAIPARGLINFDRSDMNLAAFPSNIPISVEILILSFNRIERISATDLSTFVEVTKVDLAKNQITVLEDGCFDKNGKLAKLVLIYNKIHHWPISLGPLVHSLKSLTLTGGIMANITNFDLRPLSSLDYVALGNHNFHEMGMNIIAVLPKNLDRVLLNECSFNHLPNFNAYLPGIQRITMEKNDIEHLSVEDFKNITNLTVLELTWNELQTIPDLYNMKSLGKLELAENPLVCNYTLCWIIMWNHIKTSTLTVDNAACHSPDDLRGVMLSTVNPVSIGCYEGKKVLWSIPVNCTSFIRKWNLRFSSHQSDIFTYGWIISYI